MMARKIFISLVLLNFGCISFAFSQDTIKKQIEANIKQCEIYYQEAQSKEILFDQKPGKWMITKNLLAKRHLVFKKQLWDFAEMTTKGKIKLRIHDIATVQQEAMDYSSNCHRFSDGIIRFANWATGRGPEEPIFKDWMKGK